MQTVRCGHCGLSQLRQEICKRCGRPFVDEPSPVRRPVRAVPPARWRPYLTIWTQPRATMRRILDDDPQRAVILLACLKGIADVFESGGGRSDSWNYPLSIYVGLALVLGPLLGFARVYLGGALLALTGRWLGGSAGARDCRAAIAWASVPQIAGIALWLFAIAAFGNELFLENTPRLDASPPLQAAFFAFAVGWFVLFIWAAVVRWKCLGEAHGFSAWRAFLAEAIVLAFLFALVMAVAIALIVLAVLVAPRRP